MVVVSDSAFVLLCALSHTPVRFCSADVCDSNCLCFAGSQQSQDQTSRRSGNTGEKHNENGVRKRIYSTITLNYNFISFKHHMPSSFSLSTFLCKHSGHASEQHLRPFMDLRRIENGRACFELFLHERTGHIFYCTTSFPFSPALVCSLNISIFMNLKEFEAGLFRITSQVQF